MDVVTHAWALVWLLVPLIYIAILGRRDEPAQRLEALIKALIDRRPRR
ncbi:Uncharacterised protein [Mycobacteroides abscessus subsp. abscessus]|jgi:hypothetical protein|nr:hypothetical protein [Mycobacteroides abscessus]SHQ54476.1 Uncharacterised protein [Mycobacteroides abscessus subsp. abscessus]SKI24246.1 Uncharacterised protein [Mycobacteroides abscessus subsp. massiliense]MBE5453095.1 hypothetical protein [Mycobacteroides abscessus]MBE5492503.1 hypothetical protein [Mycobacteroides abscessus]